MELAHIGEQSQALYQDQEENTSGTSPGNFPEMKLGEDVERKEISKSH